MVSSPRGLDKRLGVLGVSCKKIEASSVHRAHQPQLPPPGPLTSFRAFLFLGKAPPTNCPRGRLGGSLCGASPGRLRAVQGAPGWTKALSSRPHGGDGGGVRTLSLLHNLWTWVMGTWRGVHPDRSWWGEEGPKWKVPPLPPCESPAWDHPCRPVPCLLLSCLQELKGLERTTPGGVEGWE